MPAGGEPAIVNPSSVPFSVMCIDDNLLLVDALQRRLDLEPGFSGLHRVEDFARAPEAAEQLRPSVVLLDIDLPGGVDAMSILLDLVRRIPESRVIVFTGYPSGDLAARSMASGAWGFVSKGISSDRLIAAIHRVVDGEAVIELDD
jgi:DNA-binding NarL/FixJ family response regulator